MRTPQTSLSPREIEVLVRVAAGSGNGEIARELVITEQTVKSHLVHFHTKLGLSSRTAAVSLARERGHSAILARSARGMPRGWDCNCGSYRSRHPRACRRPPRMQVVIWRP